MMHIITISRQFGSGGRELGKRLADRLGWDYYDKEIIEQLSKEQGLDEAYVSHILNDHEWNTVHLTYRHRFSDTTMGFRSPAQLLRKQREIIERIGKTGHDCIIVGRDADIILQDYHPFRIFICADMDARLARCMKHEEKQDGEKLSEKEILRNIRRIDRERSRVREVLTDNVWGEAGSFNLTVNTTNWEIKKLVPIIAEMAGAWFAE